MKATVQKRNVVALGDHKVSEHPFVIALKDHPLVDLKWCDHLRNRDAQSADLIVHFIPDVGEMQKYTGQKPVLFVLEDPRLLTGPSESLWKDFISLHATMDDFQQVLGRLLELVTLRKHRDELLRREHLQDRYLGNMDLTQISSVVGRILQLVGESTRARNVCWISGELAQSWWSQTNRRKSNPSTTTMAEIAQSVWWKNENSDLDELMQRSWPLASIGRDWQSGEMATNWEQKCGVMRLVVERCEFDLGYVLVDAPERPLRSGRKLLRKLESYLAYAVLFEENRRLVYVDDLTSLYNQRYLPKVLEIEMARAEREEKNVSVLFLDVDYFKTVNDTRGHLVGSKLLVELAKLIRGSIRNYDYAFRYGGDEFVVVLPNTTSAQAKIVAERIRTRIERNDFLVYQKHYKITVSVGVATFPEHAATPEQILHLADEAMYYGKRASRNVVYIAS